MVRERNYGVQRALLRCPDTRSRLATTVRNSSRCGFLNANRQRADKARDFLFEKSRLFRSPHLARVDKAQLVAYFPIPLHNGDMNAEQLTQHIGNTINEMLRQKGLEAIGVSGNSRFLSDEIPIDSLDLAVLVTDLQRITGKDPFQAGFRNFRTVGELANLYAT